MSSKLTYNTYLKIPELLNLQRPLSSDPEEHDETLFIIIHQVYELWFKQILHELDGINSYLVENHIPKSISYLKRVLTILKIMVAQIDILETISPLSFASFRDRLQSASGFQSAQFRELEFLLGKKSQDTIMLHKNNSEFQNKLKKRYDSPTLYDHFLLCLSKQNYNIPNEILKRDFTKPYIENEDVQNELIEIYKNDPTLHILCELLTDLDEGLQEWRYRHVKMVERTIGAKIGTGGSLGAEYLKATLFTPLFKDLWAIRNRF